MKKSNHTRSSGVEKTAAVRRKNGRRPSLANQVRELQDSLRESERRFITLINALGDLIHVVDSELRVSFCNKALRQWHKNMELDQDPAGRNLAETYPFWTQQMLDEYRLAFQEGKPQIGERHVKIGEREFDLEIRKIPVFKKGSVVQVITAMQDITPLKRAEEALKRKTLVQEQFIKTARHLTDSPDVAKVLAMIGQGVKEISKAQACAIYLLGKDGNILTPIVTNDPLYSEEILSTPLDVESSFTGQAIKAARGLIFNDAWPSPIGQQIPGTPVEEQERVLAVPFVVDGEALGAMCLNRTGLCFTDEDLALAETFASYAATALKNSKTYHLLQREVGERQRAEAELKRSFEKLHRLLEETVNVLLSAVEIRDPYTAGHQRRVTVLACAIAEQMRLSKDQIDGIRMASLIHDVGKIYVPAEILSRPGKLTATERDLIQIHPQAGYDVLKLIEFPWPVAQIVLQHHERLNGTGFPQGLKEADILLEAKILGVADVVEAMSSHRPYRPAHMINEALVEIKQNSGVLYDARVVEACLRLFTKNEFRFDHR